jgi:hypothetical protein
LADAKVEQHCHRYGHYDEHQSHGLPPARCRASIGAAPRSNALLLPGNKIQECAS